LVDIMDCLAPLACADKAVSRGDEIAGDPVAGCGKLPRMVTGKRIRFGVVGCGRIGSRHAAHIRDNPRAELVGVCDVVGERARGFAAEYGGTPSVALPELLATPMDVVSICTPSGMHAGMSIDVLSAGVDVLCEKPMALSVADCDRVIAAEAASGRRFFLVKQNRFNAPVRALKDAVFRGRLGRVTLVGADVLWNRNRAYYASDAWKGTMAEDGGALMTQCSHFLDLMIWIGGPAASVSARMANLDHGYIETEDTGVVAVTFASGALGVLKYTTCTYRQSVAGSMTVVGTDGTVMIGGQYLNALEHWDVRDLPRPADADEAPLLPGPDGTYKGSRSRHGDVIENVVAVLLDGHEIKTNSAQGRESVEVMQAAYVSALERREVRVPLTGPDAAFKLDGQPPLSGRPKSV
jgi:UDP-N-acetyl-2-amino-2-deoxyglucuronate dehydrogenase